MNNNQSAEHLTVILEYLSKPFSYQNGALIFLSLAPSFTVMQFFDMIMQDIDMRNIIIPLTVFCALFSVYIMISAADFYTGISASKKEHITEFGSSKGYIQNDKLWSSIWKFFGVLMISSVLVIFILIFAILDITTQYYIFMYALILFFLIVVLFDLHSIGNNQERRFGKKPKIYMFLDDVIDVVKNGVIKKIGKLFE